MKGERRYPKGKYPIYDQVFEQTIDSSPVLNKRHANKIGNDNWNHLPTALYILEGDPEFNFFYKLGDADWQPSLILSAKAELRDSHDRFGNWAKEEVRTGKCLKKPTEWPQPFLELRLKREAVLDARYKEVAFIKQKKADEEAEKEKQRIKNILPEGPLGKMSDNMIDGQNISYSADDIPFIDEPHSPYHGMPLFWYKKMSDAWIEENGLSDESLLEERNRLWEKDRAEAAKKGLKPPTSPPNFKQFKREKFSSITKADYPDWLPDAKPINELE